MDAKEAACAIGEAVARDEPHAHILKLVQQAIADDPVRADLLEALNRIAHQAVAGIGTLDEHDDDVGAEDFVCIEQLARAAIATAKPEGE